MRTLTLTTDGDRHVLATRHFAAAPEAIYRAHIEPGLIQQWMLGPDGWSGLCQRGATRWAHSL